MECYADEDVVASSCDTVFNLLGSYDRGMVYEFNDDFSGEIIHEIKKESCGDTSYLGMRFPAGDIPVTSRVMYIKNGLRYIHNSGADNVPLVVDKSFHEHSIKEEIDLSHIRMRSVVKAHVMYLQNMGVKCSMSIAIVVEGKLWGLLAFHGYTGPVKMEALMKKRQSNRIIKLSEIMMQWEQHHSLTYNFMRLGKQFLSFICMECASVSLISILTNTFLLNLQEPRSWMSSVLM
jgi:light-regulated signal transduction histidine kinase (bacteriophytochrome)